MEQLKAQLKLLYDKKIDIDKEISRVKKKVVELQYGVKDGEIVLFNGKKAIVRLLENPYFLTVSLMKKDGDFSSTIRYVYGGDKIEKIV